MKFNVGDKIMIKGNSKIDGGKYAGRKGIIRMVARGVNYPYYVDFGESLREMPFLAIELEKED